jgi:hypothetical protein
VRAQPGRARADMRVPTAPAIEGKIDFQIETAPMAPRPPIGDSGDIGTSPFLGSSPDKSLLARIYVSGVPEPKYNGASRNKRPAPYRQVARVPGADAGVLA